jgi:hypothetical protein
MGTESKNRTITVKGKTGILTVEVVRHEFQATEGEWFTTEKMGYVEVGEGIVIERANGARVSAKLISK